MAGIVAKIRGVQMEIVDAAKIIRSGIDEAHLPAAAVTIGHAVILTVTVTGTA